ncbi:MAG: glutaredoxin family protein [Gammaproteobacteria bacterium]|nr:glutaredoxin family protein [Gammaproteobacteria bacterium]
MWQQLQEMRKERPFALQAVDVDGSRALVERFGQLVPVLAAGEHILCSYYLDPVALRSFLDRREGAV